VAAPATDLAVPGLAPVPAAATPAPSRRDGLGIGFWLPMTWISLVVVGALTAPWLKHVPGIRLQPATKASPGRRVVGGLPSLKHWLGTDDIGRDMFSRIVWGGRVALAVGVVSVLFAMLIGGALGMLAAYYRGKAELGIMTVVSTLLAFPALILVIAITAFMGHDLNKITLAIAIVAIPAFARISYANTLSVAQREYVMAARSLGAKDARILTREILPNVILPLSAYALVVTAVAIVAEGSLAFLGLSVERPQPSWGTMINDGRKLLTQKGVWNVTFIPAGVMFLTVLSLNLIGERLRKKVDPREART
jgi:peptide/nickel transport system permease protein